MNTEFLSKEAAIVQLRLRNPKFSGDPSWLEVPNIAKYLRLLALRSDEFGYWSRFYHHKVEALLALSPTAQ